MAAVEFDDSAWDDIEVPAHWVLQDRPEWGQPIYTNVSYPFPMDAPHVPDDNPTGDYRVTFELSDELLGGRLYLRFDGVESVAIASLNGTRVGVVRGSRLAQELDITSEARPGRNVLHVRVHQWSAATYLENQDQWWLPGIFRAVTLISRPEHGIEDVWLRADYDTVDGRGRLLPEVRATESAFPITVRLEELGVEQTFASSREVGPIDVGPVEPWSADVPRLYRAEVTNAVETLDLRVGFRRVEIVGHEWRVNGRKLRLRGVNKHEYDPDHGRVFDREQTREAMLLMKRSNINAIRTSHYPPHPEFFDLADELGFWVINEGDLETHGFVYDNWVGNPSDDPLWRDSYLDRVERQFERDKNHPCIVSWSLGNESGSGENLAAMAAWLKARDPERPVHYESDYEGRYSDIVSRMYSTLEQLRAMSAGLGRNDIATPGRTAKLAERPMILCEYLHAMGNGAGAVADYEELFDTLPQWHGGFVWEWRDHGLRTSTQDGQEFYGYGGDFGEELHDGSFVCDGMVLSDFTPTPMLTEYAAVVTPIKLRLKDGRLEVDNRRHAGDTADLRFRWRDELDGREVASGKLDVPPVPAGEQRTVPLPGFTRPDQGELWRTFECVSARDEPWAVAGHVVSSTQQLLQDNPTPLGRAAVGETPDLVEGAWVLGDARFDAVSGDLIQLGSVQMAGPHLELFRAPTENDSLSAFPSYVDAEPSTHPNGGKPAPSWDEQWRQVGLDRLHRRVISVTAGPGLLTVRHRYAPAAISQAVTVELTWSLGEEGLRMSATAVPSENWPGTWARIGLRFDLPAGLTQAAWFGTGPSDNYADSAIAARVGRYESAIEDLITQYAVPQESGHRGGMRELRLPELGLEMRAFKAGGERPGFTLRAHSVPEVAEARHPHELPPSKATYLWLDVQQQGLGSRSCGPDVRPEYMLRPRMAQWALEFRTGEPRPSL